MGLAGGVGGKAAVGSTRNPLSNPVSAASSSRNSPAPPSTGGKGSGAKPATLDDDEFDMGDLHVRTIL